MVRISAKTQYNLMRAVERYSNYYKTRLTLISLKEYTVIQIILLSITSQEFLTKILGVW